jgi:hypothetical protein
VSRPVTRSAVRMNSGVDTEAWEKLSVQLCRSAKNARSPQCRRSAVAHGPVVGVSGDRDPVAGLVPRVVVARKPGGGAVGLPRDQGAVGEFLPAHFTPQAPARGRVALVADIDSERLARQQGGLRNHDELFAPRAELPHLPSAELDLGGPEARQVHDDGRRRKLCDRVQDGTPAQAVTADLVVELEFIARDAVGGGAVAGQIRIRCAGTHGTGLR